jgi:hypothetical protein
MYFLTPGDLHFCKWLGEARYKDKQHYASYKPLSKDFAMIGVAGELLFSLRTGYAVDTVIRPKGDGGIDFRTPLGTVDVKTGRMGENPKLLVKAGTVNAFIYVLVEYQDDPPGVKFLGYTEACTVRNHPPALPNRHDIINHEVPLGILDPVDYLLKWLKDIDPGPGKLVPQMTDQEFHRRTWARQALARWGSLTPPPPKSLEQIWAAAGLSSPSGFKHF